MVQISWLKNGQDIFKLEYQSEIQFILAGLSGPDFDKLFISFLVDFCFSRWRDAIWQFLQIKWRLPIGAWSISSFNRNASGTDSGTRQRSQQDEQPLSQGICSPLFRMFFITMSLIFEQIVRASGTISANLAETFLTPILILIFSSNISSSKSMTSVLLLEPMIDSSLPVSADIIVFLAKNSFHKPPVTILYKLFYKPGTNF